MNTGDINDLLVLTVLILTVPPSPSPLKKKPEPVPEISSEGSTGRSGNPSGH
jgi:hypothetical protein